MSSSFQTVIALGLVALAMAYLARDLIRKRRRPGCGSEACGAVSRDARAFRKKLKKV